MARRGGSGGAVVASSGLGELGVLKSHGLFKSLCFALFLCLGQCVPLREHHRYHHCAGEMGNDGEESSSVVTPNCSVSYTRHSVIRIWPEHTGHLDVVDDLYSKNSDKYDFWRIPTIVRRSVDIRVGPDSVGSLLQHLDTHSLNYEIANKDLQSSIDAEKRSIPTRPSGRGFNTSIYHTFDEISGWLDKLASECGPLCSVFSIGQSTEGRPLKVIRIGTPENNKPIIWLDAGIHAREWIAPATAIHIINKFIKGHATDVQIKYLLSRYIWYILPVANPDGYVYTWTTDRLWRKTRSVNPGSVCRGTDPNRNWDFHWGGEGTSDDPCSENYRGLKPFSEPETKAMAQYLLSLGSRVKVYLTLHSYGQYWLTPWGFTYDVPQDYGQLISFGERAINAMSQIDESVLFRVGASSRMLYLAAGGSDDWAKGAAGINFSYTVELADQGRHGFILPAHYIELSGQQMFQAIRTLASDVLKIRRRKAAKTKRRPPARANNHIRQFQTDFGASADGEVEKVQLVSSAASSLL